jgi:UDP-N-acetylglucosamine--N-acetylmuramyl-(pentapeptide) pyrophosphoryl-undecaprenol N-acetylglucosamine transferase
MLRQRSVPEAGGPVDLGVTGASAVLCASTGGHLEQLHRLWPRLQLAGRPVWITFDSPQSRSLLAGHDVRFVPYIPSRGYRQLVRAFPGVLRALLAARPDVVISTGAAVALLALPTARALGRRAVYLESVSRFDGPSMTGRILSHVPGVELYTQHPAWAGGRWRLGPTVMDQFSVEDGPDRSHQPVRVFVTLGTLQSYRFDALVDAVLASLPRPADVVWQVGVTSRSDLPGRVHEAVSVEDFARYVEWADVVVTHAGVGSVMRILELGKSPIIVPRRRSRGEHIDDHQVQIARELDRRELGVEREAGALDPADFETAARKSILHRADR